MDTTRHDILLALSDAATGVLHAFRRRPDGTGSFPFASPRIVDVYGVTAAEVAHDATPVTSRIHADDAQALIAKQDESFAAMATFHVEFRYRHPTRGEIWIEVRSTPIADENGGATWYGFINDITGRKAMEARLVASDLLNRAVLHHIPGGYVTVVDRDYRFLLAEGSLLRKLPLPPLLGKTVVEVVDKETADSAIAAYERTLNGESFERESFFFGRMLRVQHAPLRNDDGVIIAALNLAIDVTDLHEAQLALRSLSEQLEARVIERTSDLSASNRELEAFAYSVSHDLRAPLRTMQGFAQAVVEDYEHLLPDEGKRNLNFILRGALEMGRLTDALLSLSRMAMNPLAKDTVDVTALVERCLVELRPEMGDRKFIITVEPLPPCHGDVALLRPVFQNLLSNAVKYTSRLEVAHITVTGSLSPETGMVTYAVEDDGAGFDMRYVHKLFGVFKRLHRQDQFEGTGIGLAIVRRIVLRHDGSVWAEGEEGKGATFFLSLPCAREGEG